MPSTTATYRMDLGLVLDPEVPPGPLGDFELVCFTSSSGKGKLHGQETCGSLRSSTSVQQSTLALREAKGRLCATCRWPLPADSPLVAFTDAVRAIRQLEAYAGPEPHPDTDFDEAEERDAAAATAIGEYPQEHAGSADDGKAEEVDDRMEWERFERARLIRERHRDHWRYLHGYMRESVDAVAAHPWLCPFAEPLQHALAAQIEHERQALAALLRPDALLDSSVVPSLSVPNLTAGPEFAGLGPNAHNILRTAWTSWQHTAATTWRALEDDDFAARSVIYDAFGRRRKGRDEVFAALDRLTSRWIDAARVAVAEHRGAPRQLVGVKLPPLEREAYSGQRRDPLTDWEAGVIATHQVAANWSACTVALLLPHPVAERLLADAPASLSAERLDTEESGLPITTLLTRWTPQNDLP
ncbi:hypothetical protein [Streptomyces sp. CB01881]|uniref:hypothetical protein n=1 Tax=Streptomyces sp. CB01881 TaxID=2078691 RepID=UPI0011DF0A7F|nr:hypothetical protein [Streptomyces sp. CB01881]TYC72615.1 hypothetical protein EH183_10040 [Streptomyces sp. CB01881]